MCLCETEGGVGVYYITKGGSRHETSEECSILRQYAMYHDPIQDLVNVCVCGVCAGQP